MESNCAIETGIGSHDDAAVRRVGLIYDERMCEHHAPNVNDDGDDDEDDDSYDHPECPDRIRVIWNRLNSSGLAKKCVICEAKEAEDKHLALVHSENHIKLIKSIGSGNSESKRMRMAARFNSIYFSKGSSKAAYLAAGSVIEVAEKVAKGDLDSAFAVVRPPGHHAEETKPMGFCLYNNVAVATSYLLNEKSELGIKKILIVDWDVHHGNGTQHMFYKDPRVLFFSVHRYDFGTFYPASDDALHIMTGEGPGAGFNINVPWPHGKCGDADYIAVWDNVLIPVVKEFNPDIIFVSAGFDAAIGDPLGGCCVSPNGYSVMLHKLMKFAGGKIVMALEGGYNLDSIASSVHACVEVLLHDKPVTKSLEGCPFESTWRVIKEVREALSSYWPILSTKSPEKVINRRTSPSELEEIKNLDDVIKPFTNLKVDEDGQGPQSTTTSPSWRSELSKVYIYYATYGSNMNLSRFRCYIEGGKTDEMRKPCVGSMDKTIPKDIVWKTFPHRLFFGRERTATWGHGGVAFLHPVSNDEEKTHMCLYKITLEQFNDVLLQENVSSFSMSHPLFDLTSLQNIQSTKSISVELVQMGWYHNVVYLGTEGDFPILTMTCTVADIDNIKFGEFLINPPSKGYAKTIIKGLVEGKQLSEEEASAYVREASTKPL